MFSVSSAIATLTRSGITNSVVAADAAFVW